MNLADMLRAPGPTQAHERPMEVGAVVDTGAILSVTPTHVARKLGIDAARVAWPDWPTAPAGGCCRILIGPISQ